MQNTSRSNSFGFTLIEIIVAVAVMVVTMTVGIGTYGRFEDRQQIVETAKEIAAVFHRAQNNAQIGKIGSCSKLKAYRVDGVNQPGNFILQMAEVCQEESPSLSSVYTSPSGVKLDDNFTFYFRVLSGDVDNVLYRYYDQDGDEVASPPILERSWPIVVTNSGGTHRYEFTISRSGEISQGAWL